RHSSRNKAVAQTLQENGYGTLLFDLLTIQEDETYANRFNIDLLTERLLKVTGWLRSFDGIKEEPAIGYFGASTGAAATLKAAASLGEMIGAVVSRGGRPDLAGDALPLVRTATMLIVGSLDTEVIRLNQEAHARMKCEREIRIIDGASHLFEEPGKLEQVAALAVDWFDKHLITVTAQARV
ncbi:MAG TPA: hypothetical protein VGE15_12205, partial [Sphingobacteriaceae bacterium]